VKTLLPDFSPARENPAFRRLLAGGLLSSLGGSMTSFAHRTHHHAVRAGADFTNRGTLSCVLDGYPGVNLAGGVPVAPIGLPAAHTAFAKAKEIVLQPGAVANALLQITDARDYADAQCGPVQAEYLIIYRPDNAAPYRLPYATTACSRAVRMLQVSSVSVGTGG